MEIHQITDFNAPELDVYARLTENQLVNRADPENALFVAESPLVIGRALDAGCAPVSFLMEQKHIEGKGAALLALFAVISVVRSVLEPKLVAAQAGLPPLASLAAMYVGFCAAGVAGMVLAPVLLLLVKQLRDGGYIRLWR